MADDTVQMIGPDGTQYNIPAGEVKGALGDGLKMANAAKPQDSSIFAKWSRQLNEAELRKSARGQSGPVERTAVGAGTFALGSADTATRMVKGMATPGNLAAMGTMAVAPPTAAAILPYYAYQGAKGTMESLLDPRGKNFQLKPKSEMFTPENIEQGLGSAGMTALVGAGAGEARPKVQSAIDRIKTGKYADAVGELEKFRQTVSEKPGKAQRVIAKKYHAAMSQRMNMEWDNLYKGLEFTPADALKTQEALGPLSKADPAVAKWLEDNIVESKSGASVTMPMWLRVRKLSTELNKKLISRGTSDVVKAEIPQAHAQLEQVLKESAEKQGRGEQYTRAYNLNRLAENVKHFTALEGRPMKVSPLWGLGGMGVGISAGRGFGISGELGSAFIGGAVGRYIGELTTPKGRTKIPALSRAGETEFWRRLKEEQPKGTGGRTAKSGKVVHYKPSAKLVKGSYQKGTEHVPETGKYQLHEGEMVIPAHLAPIFRGIMNFLTPGTDKRGQPVPLEQDPLFGADTMPATPKVPSQEFAMRQAAQVNDPATIMRLLRGRVGQP